MGQVLMNGPPDCPDGQWCPACLMTAKQRQWEMHGDEIKAGYDASGEKLTVIPWLPALTGELHAGRWRAVCGDFPGLGMIDGLCWNHVAGINPTVPEQAPLIAAPAGLIKKRRG